MTEIKDHIAYGLLETKYDRVCLDYVILKSDEKYEGADTHKKAVIMAFSILNKRFENYEFAVNLRPDEMIAEKVSISELLELPPDSYDTRNAKSERNYSIPAKIPYWYAFLEPPFGTPYQTSDFVLFNESLFPNKEGVEVYRWNDDFSDYFDAGKEWWGTGLWTVYDENTKTMVVIGASLTD